MEVVGVGIGLEVEVVEKAVVAAAASWVPKSSILPIMLPVSRVRLSERDGSGGMEGMDMLGISAVVVEAESGGIDMVAYFGPHSIGTSPGNPLACM